MEVVSRVECNTFESKLGNCSVWTRGLLGLFCAALKLRLRFHLESPLRQLKIPNHSSPAHTHRSRNLAVRKAFFEQLLWFCFRRSWLAAKIDAAFFSNCNSSSLPLLPCFLLHFGGARKRRKRSASGWMAGSRSTLVVMLKRGNWSHGSLSCFARLGQISVCIRD